MINEKYHIYQMYIHYSNTKGVLRTELKLSYGAQMDSDLPL